MYISIYMYISSYIYIYIYVYIFIHIYLHVQIHTYEYRISAHIYIYILIYVHKIHISIHIRVIVLSLAHLPLPTKLTHTPLSPPPSLLPLPTGNAIVNVEFFMMIIMVLRRRIHPRQVISGMHNRCVHHSH